MGLSSSARIKKRYILLKAESQDVVKNAILDYIGILGWAKAMPVFLKSEEAVLMSVERGELNNVLAAFAACSGKIKVLKVSGTIKGLD